MCGAIMQFRQKMAKCLNDNIVSYWDSSVSVVFQTSVAKDER